ncbi:hypothetical protein [Arthrobacter sp. ISL-48]|nr:hypothetical protein [Arthrobacter sp. ISL-48]
MPVGWYGENDVDLRLSVSATNVEPDARTERLRDGSVGLDQLLPEAA